MHEQRDAPPHLDLSPVRQLVRVRTKFDAGVRYNTNMKPVVMMSGKTNEST